MGYVVLGLVQIELKDIKKEALIKVEDEIKILVREAEGFDYDSNDYGWSFTLQGNKGVDNDVLEKIKTLLKKHKAKFSISSNEYTESDGGYYYDTDEDEIEEEKTEKRCSD